MGNNYKLGHSFVLLIIVCIVEDFVVFIYIKNRSYIYYNKVLYTIIFLLIILKVVSTKNYIFAYP